LNRGVIQIARAGGDLFPVTGMPGGFSEQEPDLPGPENALISCILVESQAVM
jgi:hypothetical protein